MEITSLRLISYICNDHYKYLGNLYICPALLAKNISVTSIKYANSIYQSTITNSDNQLKT